MEKTRRKLDITKLMLENFNTGTDKLNEILVTDRRDPRKSELNYEENKGKSLMKSPTVLVIVKATNCIGSSECWGEIIKLFCIHQSIEIKL